MARTFNGSTDKIVTSLGALGVFGPGTLAMILRKTSDGTGFVVPISVSEDDFTAYYAYFDNGAAGKVGFWNGSSDATNLTNFLFASDGWALVAFTKPTGSATMRAHKVIYGSNTVAHTDMSAIGNSGTPTGSVTIGQHVGGDGQFPGSIAIGAVYDVAMTDQQVESLAYSLPAWFQAQPKALWLLDQSATGQLVNDLSGGGANQTSITGTSVATVSVPVFDYGDGIWTPTIIAAGGVAPPTPPAKQLSALGVG